MKKNIRNLFCLASSLFVMTACNSAPASKPTPNYFKEVAEAIEEGLSEDTHFMTFYDEENRFYAELNYGDHFHLELKIVEYDLWDFVLYPNEGVISEDYDTITFEYTANEETDLFKKGAYVLKHEIKDNKDTFSLKAVSSTYNLTLSKKERPNYILKDLVGEFEYLSSSDATLFSMKVEVGEKSQGYPVTISLEEGDKSFTASNIKNSGNQTAFAINGQTNGNYVKKTNNAVLSYSEDDDEYKLKIDSTSYSLFKTKGMDDKDTDGNYFISNSEKLKFSCDDFEISLSYTIGDGQYISLRIKELVAEGNTNINCMFKVTDDNTIENMQTMTNPKNKIFIVSEMGICKLTHSVVNNQDRVDIVINSTTSYQNLTISEIE